VAFVIESELKVSQRRMRALIARPGAGAGSFRHVSDPSHALESAKIPAEPEDESETMTGQVFAGIVVDMGCFRQETECQVMESTSPTRSPPHGAFCSRKEPVN
jgi:hypothetical protein